MRLLEAAAMMARTCRLECCSHDYDLFKRPHYFDDDDDDEDDVNLRRFPNCLFLLAYLII